MAFMKIIDITKPIEVGKLYYPSLPPPQIVYLRHYTLGHNHWTSEIKMPLHVATHIDAPAHFINGGPKIGDLGIESLMGIAQVLDYIGERVITKEHFLKKSINAPIVLLKVHDEPENYTYLDEGAASFIVEKKVRLLGTQAPSVDMFGDKTYRVHKLLLSKGIPIVEGLNLSKVSEGLYVFICLPILISNAEAAPARAVLIELDSSVLLKNGSIFK